MTTISTSVFLCSVTTLDSTISTWRPKDANFVVSYLVESCGLAPEAAKCLQIGFSDNPEASRLADGSKAVIEIFNHHGFHDYHIARLLLKKPQFLSADPYKELRPKVELMASLGVHPSSAAEILLNFPSQHLQDRFIPFVDFLTSVHFSGEEVVEIMMVYFCHKAGFDQQSFLGNMAILRKVGMSNSIISHFQCSRKRPPRRSFSQTRSDLFETEQLIGYIRVRFDRVLIAEPVPICLKMEQYLVCA